MVATPGHIPGAQSDPLVARVAALEKILAAQGNKTLYSASVGAGGITINGGRITITSSGGIQLPAGGTITDAVGNIIFSADALSGQRLSTPFLAIPASPMWDGNDGAAFRTGGSVGDYVYQAQHCVSEVTLWQGVIPQVVHPAVRYFANVGRVTGTTSTPTYRLYVNGTVVDTFTHAPRVSYGSPLQPITAITSFGSQGVGFALTVEADVTSSDYFAATFNTLAMCGN
jgi:hypothetical protein